MEDILSGSQCAKWGIGETYQNIEIITNKQRNNIISSKLMALSPKISHTVSLHYVAFIPNIYFRTIIYVIGDISIFYRSFENCSDGLRTMYFSKLTDSDSVNMDAQ